jgi:hypothetical protein
MPQALSDVIRRVRSLSNEPVVRFYTDTEITDWVNDAARDIARRTEDLENISTTTRVMAAVGSYPAPADMIRLHRVEFQPVGSSQLYPIDVANRNEIDNIIGFNPNIQSSYPWVCWLWGTPNNGTYPLTISFYPIFATGGQLNLWYFRMPVRIGDPIATASNYNQPVDVPEGWDDLVVNYAIYRALQKAKNPEWQVRKAEYEAQLVTMIDVTRAWHDQPGQMVAPGGGRWSMDWLYGMDQ